jgi:predicted nuclease of predicted toxin-antitoxin system
VRFLIDNALSVVLSRDLCRQGHDSVHVRDHGLQNATDEVIFAAAQAEDRVIVSADTDFGTLLALRRSRTPSFILLRGAITRNSARSGSIDRHQFAGH